MTSTNGNLNLADSLPLENANDGELDQLLTEFLTFTLGNKVIEASPEYARERAKAAIQSLLERRGLEARKDEIQKFLAVNVSHPEAYATAIAIHADNRLAELSQRGEIRAKHG